MPGADQPPAGQRPVKVKRSRHVAAVALRVLAGAVTLAAVVGGAGWLIRQRSKRRWAQSDEDDR